MIREDNNGAGTNLLNSITGHVEKAVIEIHDGREVLSQLNTVSDWNVVPVSGQTTARVSVGGLSNVNGSLFTNDLNEMVGAIVTGNAQISGTGSENSSVKKGHCLRRYKVKFNPSTLRLAAAGGGKYHKENISGVSGSGGVGYNAMDREYSLSVELILDSYNFTDCFMNPTTRLSVSGLASTAAGALSKKKVNGKEITVREQVEALTGALRNSATKFCSFCWGPMKYDGVLSHVNAVYTMFDMKGNPVRAKVNIKLILADYTLNGKSLGSWQKSFDIAFKNNLKLTDGKTEYEMGNKKASQYIQNFLNLG